MAPDHEYLGSKIPLEWTSRLDSRLNSSLKISFSHYSRRKIDINFEVLNLASGISFLHISLNEGFTRFDGDAMPH